MSFSVTVGKPEPKPALLDLENRRAVLVGINKHVDSIISSLNFSVKDIQEFHKILVDPKKGKHEDKNVAVLSDTHEEKPTRNNILSKLTTMSKVASPRDSILFYFSGHGHEKSGKSYLLCSDSYTNTLEETAIPTETIRSMMENSQARVKIIILDACHSGAIKGIKDSGAMTKTFFETFFPAPEGFVVLTSCKLGEYSYEWLEKEHGVFSYYLLEGMRGAADSDGDRIVTITDAHRFTSENVKRWAFLKGAEQSPTLEARISGDIPLAFVEEILEKEEPVDKSIVKRIILSTAKTESPQGLMEKMCGALLQFFEPDKIEKSLSEGTFKFPFGKIYSSWLSDRVKVDFEYMKGNWSKTDEVIRFLDKKYRWQSIEYELAKRMKIGNLVRRGRESNFEVVSFSPEKRRESLTFRTDAWLNSNTIFQNSEDSSNILISKKEDDWFPDDFYSTLNPENVIDFIKDCLE